jgi:putative membrane protein
LDEFGTDCGRNPFNNDENDIPMEAISQNIERSIDLILNKA